MPPDFPVLTELFVPSDSDVPADDDRPRVSERECVTLFEKNDYAAIRVRPGN